MLSPLQNGLQGQAVNWRSRSHVKKIVILIDRLETYISYGLQGVKAGLIGLIPPAIKVPAILTPCGFRIQVSLDISGAHGSICADFA